MVKLFSATAFELPIENESEKKKKGRNGQDLRYPLSIHSLTSSGTTEIKLSGASRDLPISFSKYPNPLPSNFDKTSGTLRSAITQMSHSVTIFQVRLSFLTTPDACSTCYRRPYATPMASRVRPPFDILKHCFKSIAARGHQ
jgi:hypothetical protein